MSGAFRNYENLTKKEEAHHKDMLLLFISAILL